MYGLLLAGAIVALVVWFVALTDASRRAKGVVGGLAVISFLIPSSVPYVAILLKLGVCAFVVLYLKAIYPET
jgi:hypothetical protein